MKVKVKRSTGKVEGFEVWTFEPNWKVESSKGESSKSWESQSWEVSSLTGAQADTDCQLMEVEKLESCKWKLESFWNWRTWRLQIKTGKFLKLENLKAANQNWKVLEIGKLESCNRKSETCKWKLKSFGWGNRRVHKQLFCWGVGSARTEDVKLKISHWTLSWESQPIPLRNQVHFRTPCQIEIFAPWPSVESLRTCKAATQHLYKLDFN